MEPKYLTLIQAAVIAFVLVLVVVTHEQPSAAAEAATASVVEE